MSTIQPPAPYVPPANLPPAAVEGEAIPAEIVKLPPSLTSVDRPVTLKGEVQSVSPEGVVRIATPRGPVDVKLPEPLPARGQSVEVQVPAGQPPRSVAVTLPPQQNIPQPTTQPLPQPLPNVPTQGQVPTTPAPVSTQAPVPTPAQTPVIVSTPPAHTTPAIPQIQEQALPNTPLPANAPAQSQQQAPTQPGQQTPVAYTPITPQLNPQGLLNFLKNSLQAFMKAPDTVPTNAANVSVGQIAQRPLQIGQMVRLTPLPAGQPVLQMPTPAAPNAPATATTITIPVAPQAPAQVAITPQTIAPSIPQNFIVVPPVNAAVPAAPVMPLPVPAAAVTITAAPLQAGVAPTGADAITRLLSPIVNAPNVAAAITTSPQLQTTPLVTQLTLAAVAQQLKAGAAPIPAQQPATPNGQVQTPAQPQPHTSAQPLDVRVAAIVPPAQNMTLQSPALAPLLQGTPNTPAIFAQVAGQTPQGLPVVEMPTFTIAPDGTPKPASALMVLQFPAKGLAPAAILKMDVLQQPQTLVPAATMARAGETFAWDALDDIFRALPREQGQAALQAVQAAIPKPGGVAFTAPVMMLASALRGGDITAWLGEKGLEAIRGVKRADVLARISSDFSANARRADDAAAPQGDWKSLALPMLYGQEVSRIQLYYRSFNQDAEGGMQGKKTGTRFVMDLSLTRMGPMQIDGFSVGNKLDVTLRSEHPLSAPMRDAMRARYHEAVSGIGFNGELNFNSSADHKGWIVIDNPSQSQQASA